MKKYKDLYYTVRHTGWAERNSKAAIKLYSWTIRNKEGEALESSETECDGKDDACFAAEEAIDAHYN